MPEPLVALSLPPQACLPTTAQGLINLAAQYLGVQFPTNYTQIVISDTTPAPADNGKIWLKVDGSGNPIGFFKYAGGVWTAITPQNVFFGIDTGAANAISVNISNYPYATQQNGLFIVKVKAANTGATTLAINAFGAVAVKIGGADPYANAFLADRWYAFTYTGTTFEPLNPTPPVQSPTRAAQYVYTAPSGTAPVAIPSGNTTVPLNSTLPNSGTFGTLSGNAVALGEGTYFITGGVQLVDTAGTPGASVQLAIKNASAYINWQDAQVNNVDDTAFVTVQAIWVVPAAGSASISLEVSLSAGNLHYGVDQTSARAERIASLTILKLA